MSTFLVLLYPKADYYHISMKTSSGSNALVLKPISGFEFFEEHRDLVAIGGCGGV